LPIAALLALAMTGFICIVTETLPAGLLPQIASGLEVTSAMAGQAVTAYALGSLLAAIPLTIATSAWRRRNVLLLTVIGFLAFNTLTALSPNFWLTMAARFMAGTAAGLAWSLLAGYARRMVRLHQQGQAMAIAMIGTPIALAVGVPLGTSLGNAVGWRLTFGIMSALAVILIIWIIAVVPDYPGQPAQARQPLGKVLSTPGVRTVLATVIMWMLAHNILYTYIAPFVAQAGQLEQVDVVLLTFGLASLVGIWATSRIVDRHLRTAVLASLAFFWLTTVMFALLTQQPVVIYCGVALWGLTFGGAATLLQTALADTAGDAADVALSMNVVAWNSAIAGGGILGGILLDHWGAASFPWVMALLLAAAYGFAWNGRTSGFPPGPRQANAARSST
jgi:predicted MFS family arabinose efflux permease